MYPSGSPSDPTVINTPLDEHSPSWSQDGRYLAFVRSFPAFGKQQLTGSVREAIEVFDNQSQMLVEPDGFTIDTITPSNDHAVRNHMSIALDPRIFHATCFSLPRLGAGSAAYSRVAVPRVH
jgi:WD40-like Beta Propeller Repeat